MMKYTLKTYIEDALHQGMRSAPDHYNPKAYLVSEVDDYISQIESACGLPDSAEACRAVLKICKAMRED